MPREGLPIKALLWRTFTPAIVVVAIAISALVYNRLYDTILDGFSRKLVTTAALTGALIDPADHDGLMAAWKPGGDAEAMELTRQYLHNVEPMRRIKRELGLTYLYTQAILPPRPVVSSEEAANNVYYVLDANQDDDHSPIGSEDDLPDATLNGLRKTARDGSIYVSPIQFQEQWGLLKTAAGPVRGQDGRITATAGADVNISVIEVATQNALFISALIGVASLIASALVTFAIVRWVAQPIERLKADALRIAAGDRAPPARMPAPREVIRLRDGLGSLAEQLIGSMRTARSDTATHHRARNLALLEEVLRPAEAAPTVTLLDTKQTLATWVPPEGGGAETALQRRAMELLAQRIAAIPGLARDWTAFVGDGLGAILVVDRKAKRAELFGTAPATVRLGGTERRMTPGETVAWEAGA